MPRERKYTFGPVPSRRLGLSLGVDIIPNKLCSLDCVYCEVGITDKRGLARKEYLPANEILAEVKDVIAEYPDLDHITISGSGEPTLNSKIGDIIRGIKHMTSVPVAVLTNGTLLDNPEVRRDLMDADIVSPSLDAVSADVFEKVDRPNPKLRISTIIDGIKAFRREYQGRMWIEILFVKGMNDHDEEVFKMKQVLDEILPEKIHLNTVIRPPAYAIAQPVDEDRLKEIQKILGERSEIVGIFKETHKTQKHSIDGQAILALLKRRAMTVDQMTESLAMQQEEIIATLKQLDQGKCLKSYVFNGEEYYQALQK
ncbi:MAG: radical SAM protein [Ignavibacteriales bacterium]|nr:radical SAM protein [Ignavibacteriales bacterium]